MGCLYFTDLPASALNQAFLQEHIHPEQFQLQQQELQLLRQETEAAP